MTLLSSFLPVSTMSPKSNKMLLKKTRKVAPRQKTNPKYITPPSPTDTDDKQEAIPKTPQNGINLKKDKGFTAVSKFSNIINQQREIFNKTFSIENGTEIKRVVARPNATTKTSNKKELGKLPITKKPVDLLMVNQQEEEIGLFIPLENNEIPGDKRKRNSDTDDLESPKKILKKKNEEELTNLQKKKIAKENEKLALTYLKYVTPGDGGDGVKSTKMFACKICNKESTAKADLMKHIRVHTGERPFKCNVCDASFVQITALRGHETIHSGMKPFNCDVCDKKFAIKDRLRLHMRVHTGEKPHKCKECNLSFARRSQVSQHMRIHDTTKTKYPCEECGSTFASYHSLKSHTNGHLGIKEFQCCACGKKFLRVEGMYKHMRTVHRGNRPYTCNICGKAFKGHLQQHMRLHRGVRPYTCHLCDAAFTQNSQLTVHLRIHTGERPYKCQVCGSSFAHSSACKIHMRSHTGEKPFRCVICSNAFSQLPHLKKHMKCVHGAEKPYMCIICKDFFKTQAEIDSHRRFVHNIIRSAEEEAQETVEDATLARLRNRLAVLLYRISSEDRRSKFGFGSKLVDDVLKLSLESSGHTPVSNPSIARLEELRQNVLTLLRWTIPQETMEEYHKNKMTVDEVLDILTS